VPISAGSVKDTIDDMFQSIYSNPGRDE